MTGFKTEKFTSGIFLIGANDLFTAIKTLGKPGFKSCEFYVVAAHLF